MGAVIRRAQFKLELLAGGTEDLKFTDNSYTYLGTVVETIFNELTINNRTTGELYYSIEPDPADAITVDDTALQGVGTLKGGQVAVIDNTDITRLRIEVVRAGDVNITLFNNARTSYR